LLSIIFTRNPAENINVSRGELAICWPYAVTDGQRFWMKARRLTVWDQRFDGILREHMPDIAVDDAISPNEEMASLGITSMLLLSLMLALEREYEIRFPMDALIEESFRSPASIWLAVESLRESQSRRHPALHRDGAPSGIQTRHQLSSPDERRTH
jgi:acyl carrier protein